MVRSERVSLATCAIMTMAEIKAAIAAFERGEVSVFEALATVGTEWQAYESAVPVQRQAA